VARSPAGIAADGLSNACQTEAILPTAVLRFVLSRSIPQSSIFRVSSIIREMSERILMSCNGPDDKHCIDSASVSSL